ncbi:hypothetical protein HanXRQr2_Chr16g0736351 [Helianthus annuus]|uniref:Uncharacterized protein n=1 Tax=Helianthus annuus TaxID=4232 RepID=A0A9K3DRX6_HELAN|nr:hypothetical protein HanXRQr2_Chr16g0736351 [Helianthus annuus]KAJ0820284.1 hypothetical protein HanPSC8_Chr16g0706081 [Helianthus annuus]
MSCQPTGPPCGYPQLQPLFHPPATCLCEQRQLCLFPHHATFHGYQAQMA